MVRTRYAPSPTGPFHIGAARAALFGYAFAKNSGGAFVVRIEDTDLERSDKEYERDIFENLHWLGIVPDESPEMGGSWAPYRQTERTETYARYARMLLDRGAAFYCFHFEGELERERKELMDAKKPPVHVCEYRSMAREEQEMMREVKESAIIRFKTPVGKTIVFSDLIRGGISFESDILGDFSLAKKLSVPLYNFAVVVDDHEMEITHVIRGEDHIPNTPKQILIIEALEFLRPQYAHLPLILGPDRSKLSKRHGAASVGEYRREGYLPDALFNFIALLGWSPGSDKEIMSREEIVRLFSLERVGKSGAIFDIAKLDWMNGEYIRKKSSAELTKLCTPYLEDFLKFSISPDGKAIEDPRQSRDNNQFSKEYIESIIALEQPRIKKLSEIGERVEYFFRDPVYDKELLRWKSMENSAIRESLDKSYNLISSFSVKKAAISKEEIEKSFLEMIGAGDKGSVLWPLRVALTGKKASPGPFEILSVIPKKTALKRIKAAILLVS